MTPPGLLILLLLASPGLATAEPDIAPMTWTQRSDWINVRTDPGLAHRAVGDGIADDTQAIKDALALALASKNALGLITDPEANQVTVYLPPGTYKITATLGWEIGGFCNSGLSLVGNGSRTTVAWHGPAGGIMFHSLGVNRSRYVGIRWDGRGVAADAIRHEPRSGAGSYAEYPVRHWNEAFLNCTGVGLNAKNRSGSEWSGGFLVTNCLFRGCAYGTQIGLDFPNEYEFIFEDCEFDQCDIAIDSHGNTAQMVYDTHFNRSRTADMVSILPVRARRCTSTGSRAFLVMPEWTGAACQMHVLQDCWVDGWTNPGGGMGGGAVVLGDRCMAMIFDCRFTNPPDALAPVNLISRRMAQGRSGVIVANNRVGADQAAVARISVGGGHIRVLPLNLAPRNPNVGITSMLGSPGHVFLDSTPVVDGPLIDLGLPPYGARRDGGADAAPAIQRAVADAQAAGRGATVYLPAGYYRIGSTISLGGGNYRLQGAGVWTQLCWTGPDGGTLLAVDTPGALAIENLAVKVPTNQAPRTAALTVTASGPGRLDVDQFWHFGYLLGSSPRRSASNYYSMGPGLVLRDLPGGVQVCLGQISSTVSIHDCGQAEILGRHLTGQMRLQVDGATRPRTGLLGVMCINVMTPYHEQGPGVYDVSVRDSQDLVCGDYYNEQTEDNLLLAGGKEAWSGRVTIQGFKQQNWKDRAAVTVDDYRGTLFYGPQSFRNCLRTIDDARPSGPPRIVHRGANPFTLVLAVDTFLGGPPAIARSPACRLVQVLCQSLTSDGRTAEPLPDSDLADGAALAVGLDHLRELGLLDLKLRHGLPAAKRKAPAPEPVAASSPARKPPPAEALQAWNGRLRAATLARVRGARPPILMCTVFGKPGTIEAMDADGGLQIRVADSRLSFRWSELRPEEKRSLAIDLAAGKRPEDLALAAFFCLADGQEQAAEAYLQLLPGGDGEELRGLFR